MGTMRIPGPEQVTITFPRLWGGLNLQKLDYGLEARESPEMKNLWWRDGLLGCRDGQEYLLEQGPGRGICCWERLFEGYAVLHLGDGLYCGKPGPGMVLQKLRGGLPEIRGTFVPYRGKLLYKTRGVFLAISREEQGLRAEPVEPYVPVTVINCTPEGAGDLYQPENRLSGEKTVWYTPRRDQVSVSFEADGTQTAFSFVPRGQEPVASVEQVFVGMTLLDPLDYTLSREKTTVTLKTAPAQGAPVSVVYTQGVRVYHLPVKPVEAVTKVLFRDRPVTDYTLDKERGILTFSVAPEQENPPAANTLAVTYRKENREARDSILDCTLAAAYGGTGGAVLVLAGSRAQPNGYFWNGGHIALDPGYFPLPNYNLAGDSLEPVTGFGQQSGFLVVFKEHTLGRCRLGTQSVGDRAYLSLDYTPINGALGCDLPHTIRLVENNLVWCSTYGGVCRLEDTTAALENQVQCLSRKVNGSQARPGLLDMIRGQAPVCALNDGQRYWLAAGGRAFLWDYSISPARNPSWFYFEGIGAVDFFRGDCLPPETDQGLPFTGPRRVYHLDGQGRITGFVRSFRDYGGPIEKVYRFATQNFGTYERLKDLRQLRLATRSDTDTVIQVQYSTDHEERTDLTPIVSRTWRLIPRDLHFRFLGRGKFAHVAVRRPKCRHIRHFALRLSNCEPGCDMSLVSAAMTATLMKQEW